MFQVLDSQLLEMNWGMATVFIHQKITGAPADDSEDSVMPFQGWDKFYVRVWGGARVGNGLCRS